MLVTISTQQQTNDHLEDICQTYPGSPRSVELGFARAHAFLVNEVDNAHLAVHLEMDTYSLLNYQKSLNDIPPINSGYQNPRAYLVSSFYSLALQHLFQNGAKQQEQANKSHPFVIHLGLFRSSYDKQQLERLFAALGYHATVQAALWDPYFDTWGDSNYFTAMLNLTGSFNQIIQDLFYLLILLDDDKSVWFNKHTLNILDNQINAWLQHYPALKQQLKHSVNSKAPDSYLDDAKADDLHYYHAKSYTADITQQTLSQLLKHRTDSSYCHIKTDIIGNVPIRLDSVLQATELLHKLEVNPRFLIYQAPTMAFPKTTSQDSFLEHPTEIFNYYHGHGIEHVLCQEKHMGTRANFLICRTDAIAKHKFGINNQQLGIKIGRLDEDSTPFAYGVQKSDLLTHQLIVHLHEVLTKAQFWQTFNTDWFYLDCEVMPWGNTNMPLAPKSSCAHYAALATCAHNSLLMTLDMLKKTCSSTNAFLGLIKRYESQLSDIQQYQQVYRNYCWDIESIEDMAIAPFHILATENATYCSQEHVWHLNAINHLVEADSKNILTSTNYRMVDLNDKTSQSQAIDWWHELVANGSEGIVIKPPKFIQYANNALIQPAIKCRGREYLRFVYGPSYVSDDPLNNLKERTNATKERMAFYEFALGVEALERFVRNEPISRVYEAILGITALECSYKSKS